MPPPRKAKYVLNGACSRSCLLHEERLGQWGKEFLSLIGEGKNRDFLMPWLEERGIKVSSGTIGRHKGKHLMMVADYGTTVRPKKARSHLEILEAIIDTGGEQIAAGSGRIGPELTMRAIEMHNKLTQGSVWADFLEAIGAVGDEDGQEQPKDPKFKVFGDAMPDNPDAVSTADEQSQGAVEVPVLFDG